MDSSVDAALGDGLGPDPARVRRVLAIRPGGLGDVVRAVPALRHLRATYPDAELRVAAAAPARELLDACPYVDRSIDLARPGRALAEPVDVVVSFAPPSSGSPIDVDGIDAECRIAWAPACAVSAARAGRPAWPERLDDTARMLRLAWLLGGARPDHALGLWPTLADRNGAARLLAGLGRPVALLHAGGSPSRAGWPIERWGRVIELLDASGLAPVLIGDADDRTRSNRVAAAAGIEITDLTGCSSVGELAGLLERAALFVGVDSGPAALAMALGTRSVIIGAASPYEPAGRPGVVDFIDIGACAVCGERSCNHFASRADAVPLHAVLAAVSLASGRAVERWRAARID